MGHRISPTPPGPLLLTPSPGFGLAGALRLMRGAASPSLAQFLPLFLYLPWAAWPPPPPNTSGLLEGLG